MSSKGNSENVPEDCFLGFQIVDAIARVRVSNVKKDRK